MKKAGRILFKGLGWILLCVAFVLVSLLIIICTPEKEESVPTPADPVLSASSAVSVSTESELYKVYLSFPAPAMSYLSGSGMTFVSASSTDVSVSGHLTRVITQAWRSPEGDEIELLSVCPRSSIGVLQADDWHFSRLDGPELFGQKSVRMENDTKIRLHVQTDQGLYIFTVSKAATERLVPLTRSLQLFSLAN